MDILKKLFFAVLFLFPLGEVIQINLGGGFIVKPLDLGLGVLFFYWLVFKLWNKQKIKQSKIFLSLVLFSSCGLFSLITNNLHLSLNELVVSASYLLRWSIYASIFFIVNDFDNKCKRKIITLLVVVGSSVVVLGYVQYLLYPNLRNLYYLGWDEHMARLFSVFLDPNFAGAFFVLFFLLLMNIFLKKEKILIGLLAMLTLGAIFLTFSRSALIMLIVSSSILFILMNKKKWIGILLGVIFLVIVFTSRYFDIENVNLFRFASSEARIKTAIKAIEIIRERPLLGVGFNAYRYAKLDVGSRADKLRVISHADAGVDNSFLFVIATTGIIGGILYLFLWFRILKIASILAIASVTAVFVDSMFINSLFYSFIMLWAWIIIAVKENN